MFQATSSNVEKQPFLARSDLLISCLSLHVSSFASPCDQAAVFHLLILQPVVGGHPLQGGYQLPSNLCHFDKLVQGLHASASSSLKGMDHALPGLYQIPTSPLDIEAIEPG